MKILTDDISNTMPQTRVRTVQPSNIERRFMVTVSVPIGDPPSPKGWHGVLATDGNIASGTINQAVVYPAMGGELPQAVVVTIGYPMDNPIPFMTARNQDLTPTPWPEWDEGYGKVLGMPTPPSGEADVFLDFLSDQLKPAIEEEFSVDPAQWSLVGHSLGGLFATHALLNRPSEFRRYLAVGSSYWWRGGEIFKQAEAFAVQADASDIAAYIAAGTIETADGFAKSWEPLMKQAEWQEYIEIMCGFPEIVRDSQRMVDLINQRGGVSATFDSLEAESHGSAPLPALSRGLRWLHANSAGE